MTYNNVRFLQVLLWRLSPEFVQACISLCLTFEKSTFYPLSVRLFLYGYEKDNSLYIINFLHFIAGSEYVHLCVCVCVCVYVFVCVFVYCGVTDEFLNTVHVKLSLQ
jgi:hypothetical protein